MWSLLADDPAVAPMLNEVEKLTCAVVERIGSGDHAGAAEQFCETVALGPGTWAELPPELRHTFIENAPTFLDEEHDPDARAIKVESIKGFGGPALLTIGDQSPPTFAPVVRKLAEVLPCAATLTFAGAGHIPHATHPDDYVAATTAFIRKHAV